MFDREFEEFLLEQVRIEGATYYGVMITFGCCAAACIVMAAAAILSGTASVSTVLKLTALFLPLAGSCYGTGFVARARKEAAKEMEYGLQQPEFNIPDDYADSTKAARQSACRNLHSIRGMILSYGILALMLWAVTVLIIFLAGVGTSDISPMLLLVSFVTLILALGLTILAIVYIRALPAAGKYRQLIDRCLDQS